MARYPFPIPFGWFCVGYPEEFENGAPRPLFAMDQHFVGWRDEESVLHVMDAFCPHLGAHLGHGGTVDGCQIACPFHGWKFDAAGRNTEIPYSTRTNDRGRIRTYPVVERNGVSMIWWHPDATVEPMWEIPVIPELASPEWGTVIRTERSFDAHVQELAENQVDSAHFRYVHSTPTVPVMEHYETGFPEAMMRSRQTFVTPRGDVDARIDVRSVGPGLSIVEFSGIIDTIDVACNTPIDAEHTVVRSSYRFKSLGDAELTEKIGHAFVNEVDKQMSMEDRPIWEHKAYLPRPALADTDGPFMKFRKWAAQFYPEPIVTDRDVYPPPFWPDRVDEAPAKATAAARMTEDR